MSERVKALLPTIEALSEAEKEELLEFLTGDDGENAFASREEWEEHWVAECHRRIADLEAGRTKLIPGDEAMKMLKEKYG